MSDIWTLSPVLVITGISRSSSAFPLFPAGSTASVPGLWPQSWDLSPWDCWQLPPCCYHSYCPLRPLGTGPCTLWPWGTTSGDFGWLWTLQGSSGWDLMPAWAPSLATKLVSFFRQNAFLLDSNVKPNLILPESVQLQWNWEMLNPCMCWGPGSSLMHITTEPTAPAPALKRERSSELM